MCDGRHFAIYDCDGEGHKHVSAALRGSGVTLVEAGPESFYARDIRQRQRWRDAEQHAAAVAEVSRLRAALVLASHGDAAAANDALAESARLEWKWLGDD